jgi:hypothetical protein
MPRYKQSATFQRGAAFNCRVRSPFARGDGELPMLKAFKGAILTLKPRYLTNVG